MISEERMFEIVAAFQRRFKKNNAEEIESINLAELKEADEMLGHRDFNSNFRIAMRNRISELEQHGNRRRESKVRAWNYIVGIVTGLLIAGAAKLLFG